MGLVHRKEYMFRVKAVNNIGESEPLTTDRSIIAKNECGTLFARCCSLAYALNNSLDEGKTEVVGHMSGAVA